MKTSQVKTLKQLHKAGEDKKAVICPVSMAFKKPKPAKVIINLQGSCILKLMNQGLFVYNK